MPSSATSSPSVQVACSSCGQVNRIPSARLTHDPTCGRCKRKVFPHGPIEVTDASWRTEVETSPIPVLADFWAPWCPPCRALAPALERVAAARAGRLKVVKVNVDQNPALASRYAVRSIPTMVVLRDAREIDRMVGALPEHEIERHVDRVA